MKLSIVIPVYNNWKFTKDCLQDLAELPEDHEIIVVDNGSTSITGKGIKQHFPRVKYLRFNHPLGFARASNEGFKASCGDNVMFLNNDIRVERNKDGWTQEILDYTEHNLVGPTAGMLDREFNFISETQPGESIKIDSKFCYYYMSGWNLSSSRDNFERLKINNYCGPFTEEFKTYWEDTDLSFRALELGIGFKIVNLPVVHLEKKTTKNLGLASLYVPAKLKFSEKWKGKQIKKVGHRVP